MKIVAERLRTLRRSLHFSQNKMAAVVGMKQSSINRYENDQSDPSFACLLQYADYFDVSLDYIFGRTEHPEGRLYEHKPRIEPDDPEMKKFVDMCFDPKSPLQERLKQTLLQMLEETKE